MYEVYLLEEPGILVTTARFVVGQQTYPVAAITSVAPFTVKAKKLGTYVLGFFLGICAVSCGASGISSSTSSSVGYGVMLAVASGFAIWVAWARRDSHGILVSTSGMQSRALITHDAAQVSRVLGALNHAIASR